METLDLSKWHKVEGMFESDYIYRANRWESDLLGASLVFCPGKSEQAGIEINAQLEDCTAEDIQQLVRELTEWVNTLESGEIYPEYRGFDPVTRWHRPGEHSDLTLCGVPWGRMREKPAPPVECPNCREIFHEATAPPPLPDPDNE